MGHYTQSADHDEVPHDSNTELTVHHTKPHDKYNAETGAVEEVTDIVRESFGL